MRAILQIGIALLIACGGGGEANSPFPDAGDRIPDASSDGGSRSSALVRVDITPADVQLPLGTAQQLTATGVYSDHTTRDLTAQANWTSDRSDLVMVSRSGLATAVAAGTATITAEASGVIGTVAVSTTTAAVVSITVTPTAPRLTVGLHQQLVAMGIYSDGTNHDLSDQASWGSDAPAIAEVSNTSGSRGTVTARSAGTAQITAAFAGVTGAVSVTAVPVALASIRVTAASSSLPRNISERLTATGTFTDGSIRDITAEVIWSSDNQTIAAMSNAGGAQGKVTANLTGTVHITAALSGVANSTTLTVTNAVLFSLAVTPASAEITVGNSLQVAAIGTFSDATAYDLTDQVIWTWNDSTLATFSNGLVTTVAIGTLQLTASAMTVNLHATATLKITNGVLNTLTVTPTEVSLPIGGFQILRVTGQFANGATQDLGSAAICTVHDPSIASISRTTSGSPVVDARSVGQTLIDVQVNTVTVTVKATVTPAALTAFQISAPFSHVPSGFSIPLRATEFFTDGTSQDVTSQVTWFSDDSTIAAVSNDTASQGLVRGIAAGATTLRAALGGNTTQFALTVDDAALIKLAIGPSRPSVPVGLTTQLATTGTFDDGVAIDVTSRVTWMSGTPGVATVSSQPGSSGLVTGVTEGRTQITATLGSVSDAIGLDVTAPVPLSIAIGPQNPQVAAGLTVQMTAVGAMSDGSIANLTNTCSWASSSPATATVSNADGSHGLVTGVIQRASPIQITCTSTAVGTASLTVLPAAVEKIIVHFFSPFPVGTTKTLIADADYSDGTIRTDAPLIWSSDNPAIASVTSRGVLTARAVGNVQITAALDGLSGTQPMQVIPAALVSLAITPDAPFVPAGRALQLTVTGAFTDGTLRDLTSTATWTSSDPSSATVTSTGLVKSLARGFPAIRASIGAVFDNDDVTVTAPVLDSITVSPTQASLAVGQTRAFSARGTFSDASTLDITSQVTWASSASGVAAISNTAGSLGVTTAIAPGMTSITAALGSVTSPAASLTVTASAAAR